MPGCRLSKPYRNARERGFISGGQAGATLTAIRRQRLRVYEWTRPRWAASAAAAPRTYRGTRHHPLGLRAATLPAVRRFRRCAAHQHLIDGVTFVALDRKNRHLFCSSCALFGDLIRVEQFRGQVAFFARFTFLKYGLSMTYCDAAAGGNSESTVGESSVEKRYRALRIVTQHPIWPG